jgi:hypothetical protein
VLTAHKVRVFCRAEGALRHARRSCRVQGGGPRAQRPSPVAADARWSLCHAKLGQKSLGVAVGLAKLLEVALSALRCGASRQRVQRGLKRAISAIPASLHFLVLLLLFFLLQVSVPVCALVAVLDWRPRALQQCVDARVQTLYAAAQRLALLRSMGALP